MSMCLVWACENEHLIQEVVLVFVFVACFCEIDLLTEGGIVAHACEIEHLTHVGRWTNCKVGYKCADRLAN